MNEAQGLLDLNLADYIIVGVVIASALISVFRGFIKEFISLFIWILGFWVAIKFNHVFAIILSPYISSESILNIVSFCGVFVLVLIFGALLNYLLSFIVSQSGLSGTDRLLGMVFGCARGVLLVAVVLLLISVTSFVNDEWWQKSVLIPHFQVLVEWLKSFLPEKMSDIAGMVS